MFKVFHSRLRRVAASLRFVLVLTVFFGVSIPAVITSYLDRQRLTDQFTTQLQGDLKTYSEILALGLVEPLWKYQQVDSAALLESALIDKRIISAEILRANGKQFLLRSAPAANFSQTVSSSTLITKDFETIGTLILTMDSGPGLRRLDEALARDIQRALQTMLGSLVLILLVLGFRLFRPIALLSRQATDLANNNSKMPLVTWSRGDEISELGRTVNWARDRISTLLATLEKNSATLQNSFEMLAKVQKNAGMGIWKWNPQTDQMLWSKTVYEIFHMYPAAQSDIPPGFAGALRGVETVNLIHADDRTLYQNLLSITFDGLAQQSYQFRIIRGDGAIRILHSESGIELDIGGKVAYVYGFLQDITEKQRISDELDQYRNNLEQLVGQRTSALESTLSDLRATQTQLIQSEKMASLGQLVANVAHEINTPISAVKSSGFSIAQALDDTLENLPLLLQTLDQQSRDLFMQLIRHAKEPADVLSTREERAIKRETSRQLEEAGIADPSQKAGILVHLRAQSALLDYLPLLRHAECDFILSTAHGLVDIIHSTSNINTAVDRVAKIVFALKSFSRADSAAEMIDAQLSDGLETVLTLYQSQIKQGTELVRHYEDIPPLLCLPDQLNQVWTNLIHNALQAMNHKGTLSIGVRRVKTEFSDEVVVSVGDTGCGIPEAIRGKIFDAFFTTKPTGEGSGLGLDIVKKIIDKHQGRIELQSDVGVGTTFSVYLPYQKLAQ